MYRCPVCKKELSKVLSSYVCENRHSYDLSKDGYVNLVVGKHKMQGDNKELVKARTRFLESGHYKHLRDAISKVFKEEDVKVLVDLGCGEGYYSNHFEKDVEEFYGFDLSKEAIRHASKKAMNGKYAVANIFDLPLFDECSDAVLSIFTPIPKEEIKRILKRGGIFIQVEPGEKHLYELKDILYDKVIENTLQTHEDMGLECIESFRSDEMMYLQSSEEIMALLSMTPYVYKTSQSKINKLLEVDELNCLSSFYITIWRKNDE